jgi:hypothetical protein
MNVTPGGQGFHCSLSGSPEMPRCEKRPAVVHTLHCCQVHLCACAAHVLGLCSLPALRHRHKQVAVTLLLLITSFLRYVCKHFSSRHVIYIGTGQVYIGTCTVPRFCESHGVLEVGHA